jgi:hypothetical protein
VGSQGGQKMKIRLGFVTNSSSSSFVVAFPRVPENAEDVREMLFDEEDEVEFRYDRETKYTTSDLAAHVFAQMEAPADFEEIAKEFATTYDLVDYEKYRNPDGTLNWNRYRKATKKEGDKLALKFIKDNPDSFFYVFDFSDDTSIGCMLEQGGIFDKLNNVRFSHH